MRDQEFHSELRMILSLVGPKHKQPEWYEKQRRAIDDIVELCDRYYTQMILRNLFTREADEQWP